MTDAAVFLLSLGGFGLLLLAPARHQHDWLRRRLPPRTSYAAKAGGFCLLVAGYAIAAAGQGWGYGAVAWLGWLTVAAGLVLTAHTNRARILARLRK